jgi:uncharacterized protein (TIGR00369 family)
MTIEELTAFLASDFPQALPLGLVIEALDGEQIRVRQPVSEAQLRPGGTVSGPALMALADVGFYLFLLSRIGRVPLAVTTSFSINFLGKAQPGADLLAEARLLKLGRRLAVGEVAMRSAGTAPLIAHATMTYSIPPAAH